MWRYNVNGVSHHRNPKVGVISAAADEWRRGMPADAGGAYHVGSGQHTYRGLREKATKELLKHLSYNNFSRERVTCTAAAQRRAGLSGWWKKVALQWALRWAATARHIEVSLPEVGVLHAPYCIEQRELHCLWKRCSQSRMMQRRRLPLRWLPEEVQGCLGGGATGQRVRLLAYTVWPVGQQKWLWGRAADTSTQYDATRCISVQQCSMWWSTAEQSRDCVPGDGVRGETVPFRDCWGRVHQESIATHAVSSLKKAVPQWAAQRAIPPGEGVLL